MKMPPHLQSCMCLFNFVSKGSRYPAATDSAKLDPHHHACNPSIGAPYDFTHELHIKYNPNQARFETSFRHSKQSTFVIDPSHIKVSSSSSSSRRDSCIEICNCTNSCNNSTILETVPWVEQLNQHFHVPYTQVPRIPILPYQERIPAILVMLQQQFNTHQGYTMPHIFRESPLKADRDQAIYEINHGCFQGCNDVRILADLIKVWFRELPIPLLHQIPLEQLERIGNASNALDIDTLPLGAVEKSILLWLADFLVKVASFQEVNHMGIEQLAIILAPNLVRIETPNPMYAVTISKASVDFLRQVLKERECFVKA